MAEGREDFITDDTECKIREFEAKLKADQEKLPDTSVRATKRSIDAPENYYFAEGESIPIYDSGTNKQIDRIDMEVDKLRRARNSQLADEVEYYMREIRAEIEAKERGEEIKEEEPQTAPFLYIVPTAIIVLGVIVACVAYM